MENRLIFCVTLENDLKFRDDFQDIGDFLAEVFFLAIDNGEDPVKVDYVGCIYDENL